VKIVIVGHVDHGKSTLIGRLLYDTDSLPIQKIEELKSESKRTGKKMEFAFIADALEEERRNEMTIDTTQTFFKTPKKIYTIIDAPGHKEFLKNMVTGASQADAAILLVDVKEGVREQTKRHAYLLNFLGIKQIIVAMNKMDLVGYDQIRFIEVKNELELYFQDINIKPSYIIPISAYEGDNIASKSKKMPWYEGPTIVEALDLFPVISIDYDFRLPIQDMYDINNRNMYVGNILSGIVKIDDTVMVYPEITPAKVKYLMKTMMVFSASKPSAIGIVLDKEVKRGDILAKGREPIITDEIGANVFCMIEKLEPNKKYTFRCSTQEIPCEISHIEEIIDISTLERKSGNEIKETEMGIVKIHLDRKAVVEKFNDLPELGRFILEDNDKILAGGII
jgi:small GTP-binding protein